MSSQPRHRLTRPAASRRTILRTGLKLAFVMPTVLAILPASPAAARDDQRASPQPSRPGDDHRQRTRLRVERLARLLAEPGAHTVAIQHAGGLLQGSLTVHG